LMHAPSMVQFYLDHTALRFVDGNKIPDFHGKAPGAKTGGRSVCAAPFDGRLLGKALKRLRPPRDILAFLGMSIGTDLRHFQRVNLLLADPFKVWDSCMYVARRIVHHGWDCLRYGQGTLRMGGNALAAGLLRSALDKGVQLWTQHQAQALLREEASEGGRITGARITNERGASITIHARCGVVLACGGFPHDNARKAALFPHAPTGKEHHSAAPNANTGDGIRLAENVGAVLSPDTLDAGAWAPVSLVPQKNEPLNESSVESPAQSPAAFPHLIERGKPGLIAVDAQGERFVNEAGNYHSFMRALFAKTGNQSVQAWLICDHRFQRRWGLGFAKPWPLPLAPYLKTGYLKRAPTLSALAQACGIHPANLMQTVAHYNQSAQAGKDPQFGRGDTPYERMQGDAEHDGPNPCVATIEQAPFYAVRIVPGSLGTFAGLAVNPHAQVLDQSNQPIPGLYAAGNDMASCMGGHYPSGGITLGPAMTFGYVLAHHAAGRALALPNATPTF